MNKNIRNFSIIAHIDHGKSTLADRMLEITKTIEKRVMKDQVLDDMELERERGITIKMRPVRMNHTKDGIEYVLNLIDTPGHIDFSYEVSRALQAVEGTVLLVDSTQGIQAQTLTTLNMAKDLGLVIIPVLSKMDSPLSRVDEVSLELMNLLDCNEEDIIKTSGKTGEGVANLLDKVIELIPEPKSEFEDSARALIFDFQYSNHRGIILYARVFDGEIKQDAEMQFGAVNKKFRASEVGTFRPQEFKESTLGAGSIGYIVTGIKEPGIVTVGDTVTLSKKPLPQLHGYDLPKPVVWASVFPESQDDFDELRSALQRLKLSDSSLSFEEESSGILGRGYRCGLLGMLHLEIVSERLKREFDLDLIITLPSINYRVTKKGGEEFISYSANSFPDYGDIEKVDEPWILAKIILPNDYIGQVMPMLYEHEGLVIGTENLGDNRSEMSLEMPLRELMRNFFDELKSASAGYASLAYDITEFRSADVCKLEILVADEPVAAFARIVARQRVEIEAEKMVEKLYEILPRQMFSMKVQSKALGRIIASKTVSAMRKNVTAHLYGGDITRKMKLREKQKKGKKKMKEMGKVNIGQDVFLKMMKN